MADLTAEELAQLIRRMEISSDEKENHSPRIDSPCSNNINSTSCGRSFLVIVDARPFHSFEVMTSDQAQSRDDLREVSLAGSVRVHYPNLLRKRSKGKMTLENVIVDRSARSLVSSPHPNSLNHTTTSPGFIPLSDFPELSTTTTKPTTTTATATTAQPSYFVVVYDQNTASVSQLPEDCDAKLALKALSSQCRNDVNVCFLAGGLEGFYELFPDLCTPSRFEPTNEAWGSRSCESKIRNHPPFTLEKCGHFNSASAVDDKSDLPCQLLPWLYLGSQSQASRRSTIERLGITALLNVAALNLRRSPTLPIKSAPVAKLPDQTTLFPFTTRDFSISESSSKVPPNSDSNNFSRAFREHRFRHDRRMTRRGFYFKPNFDQSLKATQNLCSNQSNGIQVLNLPIADNLDTEISLWFDLCNSFIEKIRSEKGRVLVHCQAGISRSASICLAYLLWSQTSKTLNEAFEFVRSRRPVVAPNFNFLRQLKEYEASLLSGRYLYHHHNQHPLILRSIQTPSSVPSEISYIHTPENSSGRENVFRFTFDQRQSSVFCEDKEDVLLSCNDSDFGKFKQNFSFDGSQENVFAPPLLLSKSSNSQEISEAPSKRKKLLKEKKTFKTRLLEKLRKFSCQSCPFHENSSNNPRWKKLLEKIKHKSTPDSSIDVKIHQLSINRCHHFRRDANCRACKDFLSTLFKVSLTGSGNHEQLFQSSCKRHARQSSVMAHKILSHRYHHHHHHHDQHGRYHHRCRQCHPYLKIRTMPCQKVVKPDVVMFRDADGDDDDDALGISVKLTFILIMTMVLVLLVEKKLLL